jgi:isopentenyl diphosphate isomerase/L-lactate dehydrogenase-like FMN-dependent dehydrogenase
VMRQELEITMILTGTKDLRGVPASVLYGR